jgi:predicted nucleic acid-binding Zn ribbon protein
MKYKVETHFGCTATGIVVNGKGYYGEDARYSLTDDERKEFHVAFFAELKRMLDNGEIGVYELIQHFDVDRREYSDTCDQCGDSMESVYYEEF